MGLQGLGSLLPTKLQLRHTVMPQWHAIVVRINPMNGLFPPELRQANLILIMGPSVISHITNCTRVRVMEWNGGVRIINATGNLRQRSYTPTPPIMISSTTTLQPKFLIFGCVLCFFGFYNRWISLRFQPRSIVSYF